MIRVFGPLCKINFDHVPVFTMFGLAMNALDVHRYSCPKCGTKVPQWRYYCDYERTLTEFRRGAVITEIVSVSRYQCQSCGSTHAVLSEFIIPFKSHTLLFVLAVMKDYFSGAMTVSQICSKYEIAISTLYARKALFLKDNIIWLIIVADLLMSIPDFLDFLSREGLKRRLREFYATANQIFPIKPLWSPTKRQIHT